MHNKLHPVALITGSSRGIGKAIAIKLAQEGYRIALSGRDESRLNDVKAIIESEKGDAEVFAFDLAGDFDAPSCLVKEVIAVFGQLDVLVNNAGVALAGAFEEISFSDYERVMNLNVKVPLFLTKAAIPYLKLSSAPVVVNISSVVGQKPYRNQSLYSASKHALNGLMKAAAKELQEDGIRIHLISPGGVGTEMIHDTRPDLDFESLIKPEEVAEVVAFLIGFKQQGIIDEVRIRRSNNIPFD